MKKKNNINFFQNYFNEIQKSISSIDSKKLIQISKLIKNIKKDNKVIIVGNGGSASIASHVCVDYTKFLKIRSVNFNEPNLLTCFGNDYGYKNWVKEALKAYALKGDIVITISSSGQSENMIEGARMAKKMKLKVITLTGFDKNNPLKKIGNINMWVNSKIYNIVEMTHHIWLVSIVDYMIKKNKI